jgi:tRNA dimethylallyltransferase
VAGPAVIAVFGPTGVGKTAVAIALAERLRTRGEDPVAISADALQVYAGLPILTGLYLRAALADLDLRPPVAAHVRARWSAEDATTLHAALHERAPAVAAGIERGDRHRLIRALELLDAGERPPARGDSQLWTTATRHPTLLAALVMDRAELYRRIDARIDAMLAAGVEQEVHAADAAGASATARAALGFRELLQGDVEAMRTKTRRYAKRQLTWLRKLPNAHLIDVTGRDPEDVAAELDGII